MKHFYQPFQPMLTESGLKKFGLTLQSSIACQALDNTVHSFLQITATQPTPYSVIPDGTQAVFLSSDCARVGGAQTRTRDIPILQPGEYFGIWFRPGALRMFFKLDLSEITDQYVDSHYFPSRNAGRLHEHVYRCNDFSSRVAACERWLLKHYQPKPTTLFDHALSLIYQSKGNEKVENLSTQIGRSARHLNRLFKQHTGISTKTFAQIIRLQEACRQLSSSPKSTADSANELGYFDQSHLTKACNRFLLVNPGDFTRQHLSDFYNR